jgi:hypothetical protein
LGLRRGGERWVAAQAAPGCVRRSERGGELREDQRSAAWRLGLQRELVIYYGKMSSHRINDRRPEKARLNGLKWANMVFSDYHFSFYLFLLHHYELTPKNNYLISTNIFVYI